MKEQDFNNRIIIVVRKDIESWQAFNAATHVAAYLGKALGQQLVTGDNFVTKDGVTFPRNSQYPIIIKSASSNDELRGLLQKVKEENILYHAFIREMIDHTSDADLQASLDIRVSDDVELLSVGFFCDNERASKLSKAFSLWK